MQTVRFHFLRTIRNRALSLAKALGSKVTASETYPVLTGTAAWVVTSGEIARYKEDCKKAADNLFAAVKATADKIELLPERRTVTEATM